MRDDLFFILCVCTTAFIGWNILSLIGGKRLREDLSNLEIIPLSYLFGFGIITLQIFITCLMGFNITRTLTLAPWIPIIVLNIFLYHKGDIKTHTEKLKDFSKIDITIISFIVIQVLYNFFRALIKPLEAYDSVAIYAIKSKMIYLGHGIGGDFFTNVASFFQGAHPDYPLLISLSESLIYTFIGNLNDIIVKAIFPLFYLSFIVLFYAILKRITKDKRLALFATFFLATVKQFADYSTIGVADMELGIYFAISVFYFYLWAKDNTKTYLLGISLSSVAFSIWTKNEGTLLALIIVFIAFFYVLGNFKKINRETKTKLLTYAMLSILFVASWAFFKKYNNLINENFNLSMISFKAFVANLYKVPSILYEYQKQLFGFKKWNIIWILWIIVLVKGFKESISGNIKYITLVFPLFLLGYGAMYIFSAVDIKFFLSTTGSRFLLHILPIAVFWMAIIVKKGKMIEL